MKSDGKNAQQKILSLLNSIPVTDTLKVGTIARQTNLSTHTARKSLTLLRTTNFVSETNGFWSITPEGRELQQTNPNFGTFHTKLSEGSRENWWEQVIDKLGPEFISSSPFCEFVYTSRPGELDWLEEYIKLMAFAWLVRYLPAFHLEFEVDGNNGARDNKVMEALKMWLQEIES